MNSSDYLSKFGTFSSVNGQAETDLSPLSPAKTTFLAELCNPITRQAIELESCSNPLRIQQVL